MNEANPALKIALNRILSEHLRVESLTKTSTVDRQKFDVFCTRDTQEFAYQKAKEDLRLV